MGYSDSSCSDPPEDLVKDANYVSMGLGWGLGTCISNRGGTGYFVGNAGLG